MQDQRVGDVCHMEFVKTQQAMASGHAPGQFIQRIGQPFEFIQLVVHLAHELMEMQAGFAHQRDRIKKAVHQKAFAPAHATIQIHTPRNRGVHQQFFDRIRAPLLVVRPFIGTALQSLNRPHLGGVTVKTPVLQFLAVNGVNRHMRAYCALGAALRRPRGITPARKDP